MSAKSFFQDYVQLLQVSDNTDVAAKLISDGLLRSDTREERKAPKLVRRIVLAMT